jgi:catechol 2,3-dioxygenase-like lactoylglutathione lyase family enzyme
VEWKLEVVPIPVADIDRSKQFYAEQVGFEVDIDEQISDEIRFVQLTPPGSGCSIHLLKSAELPPPGSMSGLILVVDDADAARKDLLARGVDASPLRHFENGRWVDGPGEPWNLYVFFDDPDGNGWMVQERPKSGEE